MTYKEQVQKVIDKLNDFSKEEWAKAILTSLGIQDDFKLVINPIVSGSWDDEDEKTNISDELSGRVIFSLNVIDDDEISFYCGPETVDGYIHDSCDCGITSQLEKLLSKFNVSAGAATNYHTIQLSSTVNGKQIWKQVEEILVEAGAVKMKK